jgi:hypothetical protein
MADINTRISDFVWKNLSEKHVTGKSDPFWESLLNTGTELWLDTGDVEEAEANWATEMAALTTNNSLLNNKCCKRPASGGESQRDCLYIKCQACTAAGFKIWRIC